MKNPVCQVIDTPAGRVVTDPLELPAHLLEATDAERRAESFWAAELVNLAFDPETHFQEGIASKVVDEAGHKVVVTYAVSALADLPRIQAANALKQAREEAADRVNREAGAARAPFITVTTGQEATYIDKAMEAAAFENDPAPSPAKYPYLHAEAEATGVPVADVAALITLTAQAWRPISARIEGLRQGALKRIREARTTAEVEGVFPIVWPHPT